MSPLFNDTDDVSLPRRPDAQAGPPQRPMRELSHAPADREVTLNTGIVLALFFGLALLCAVFFGFGYSIGHKSAPASTSLGGENSASARPPVTASTTAGKPSPGTVAVPDYVPPAGTSTAPPRVAPSPAAPDASSTRNTDSSLSTQPSRPAPVVRVPETTTPASSAAPPAATGTVYVQVAAVSHKEDADALLSALRRRGYTVQARTDPTDPLIHVQIGPFPTKKDADTMRQKLLGDGYNSILK